MFKKIQDVPKDEFFRRKETAKRVFTRGDFDRSEKKYQCDDYEDISECIYLKKDTLVFVDFDY